MSRAGTAEGKREVCFNFCAFGFAWAIQKNFPYPEKMVWLPSVVQGQQGGEQEALQDQQRRIRCCDTALCREPTFKFSHEYLKLKPSHSPLLSKPFHCFLYNSVFSFLTSLHSHFTGIFIPLVGSISMLRWWVFKAEACSKCLMKPSQQTLAPFLPSSKFTRFSMQASCRLSSQLAIHRQTVLLRLAPGEE